MLRRVVCSFCFTLTPLPWDDGHPPITTVLGTKLTTFDGDDLLTPCGLSQDAPHWHFRPHAPGSLRALLFPVQFPDLTHDWSELDLLNTFRAFDDAIFRRAMFSRFSIDWNATRAAPAYMSSVSSATVFSTGVGSSTSTTDSDLGASGTGGRCGDHAGLRRVALQWLEREHGLGGSGRVGDICSEYNHVVWILPVTDSIHHHGAAGGAASPCLNYPLRFGWGSWQTTAVVRGFRSNNADAARGFVGYKNTLGTQSFFGALTHNIGRCLGPQGTPYYLSAVTNSANPLGFVHRGGTVRGFVCGLQNKNPKDDLPCQGAVLKRTGVSGGITGGGDHHRGWIEHHNFTCSLNAVWERAWSQVLPKQGAVDVGAVGVVPKQDACALTHVEEWGSPFGYMGGARGVATDFHLVSKLVIGAVVESQLKVVNDSSGPGGGASGAVLSGSGAPGSGSSKTRRVQTIVDAEIAASDLFSSRNARSLGLQYVYPHNFREVPGFVSPGASTYSSNALSTTPPEFWASLTSPTRNATAAGTGLRFGLATPITVSNGTNGVEHSLVFEYRANSKRLLVSRVSVRPARSPNNLQSDFDSWAQQGHDVSWNVWSVGDVAGEKFWPYRRTHEIFAVLLGQVLPKPTAAGETMGSAPPVRTATASFPSKRLSWGLREGDTLSDCLAGAHFTFVRVKECSHDTAAFCADFSLKLTSPAIVRTPPPPPSSELLAEEELLAIVGPVLVGPSGSGSVNSVRVNATYFHLIEKDIYFVTSTAQKDFLPDVVLVKFTATSLATMLRTTTITNSSGEAIPSVSRAEYIDQAAMDEGVRAGLYGVGSAQEDNDNKVGEKVYRKTVMAQHRTSSFRGGAGETLRGMFFPRRGVARLTVVRNFLERGTLQQQYAIAVNGKIRVNDEALVQWRLRLGAGKISSENSDRYRWWDDRGKVVQLDAANVTEIADDLRVLSPVPVGASASLNSEQTDEDEVAPEDLVRPGTDGFSVAVGRFRPAVGNSSIVWSMGRFQLMFSADHVDPEQSAGEESTQEYSMAFRAVASYQNGSATNSSAAERYWRRRLENDTLSGTTAASSAVVPKGGRSEYLHVIWSLTTVGMEVFVDGEVYERYRWPAPTAAKFIEAARDFDGSQQQDSLSIVNSLQQGFVLGGPKGFGGGGEKQAAAFADVSVFNFALTETDAEDLYHGYAEVVLAEKPVSYVPSIALHSQQKWCGASIQSRTARIPAHKIWRTLSVGMMCLRRNRCAVWIGELVRKSGGVDVDPQSPDENKSECSFPVVVDGVVYSGAGISSLVRQAGWRVATSLKSELECFDLAARLWSSCQQKRGIAAVWLPSGAWTRLHFTLEQSARVGHCILLESIHTQDLGGWVLTTGREGGNVLWPRGPLTQQVHKLTILEEYA